MVTDIASNYTSPAGKEFTLAAARFAAVNPASRILDLGCGYGEGACNLADEFRCKVSAIDISEENIHYAQKRAIERRVSHLITFAKQDILSSDFSEEPFDMVLAEGGLLSFIGRQQGLARASRWLIDRGFFTFSDLIFINETVPHDVKALFEDQHYHYETEGSYRRLVDSCGFDVQLMTLVPLSGWDNYYAHMAKRLEDDKGFFADKKVKLAFHHEIDVFYRMEGFRSVGYLFCIARKKN